MPTISLFYGIKVTMYFDEHPPPYFHAYFGDFGAKVDIKTGRVVVGSLPKTATRLVKKWALEHHEELAANWARVMNAEHPHRIEGLL
jgi:Domain of unknown function (DUF4160)